MDLYDFIAKYNGIAGVGNTTGNKGQCVGLVMLWVENLGLKHFYGDAKDLFSNAPNEQWIKIKNAPKIYPKSGDIVMWDKSKGAGAGHTAIVVSSNPKADSFTVLEQNNPGNVPGLACEVTTYKSWDGVIGWIRAIETTSEPTTDYEKLYNKTLEELIDMRQSRDEWKRKYSDLEDSTSKLEKDLKEHIESLQKSQSEMNLQLTNSTKTIDRLTSELKLLTEARSALQMQVQDLTTSLEKADDDLSTQYTVNSELQEEIADLKKTFKTKVKTLGFFEYLGLKIWG